MADAARMRALYARDAFEIDREYDKVMEGGLRWSPQQGLSFDAGKRVMRWGKGYAWSPVGFVERAKDPSDPARRAARPYRAASMDWTSQPGWPHQHGRFHFADCAGQGQDQQRFRQNRPHQPRCQVLHASLGCIDIDVMWLGKGSKPQSFGVDFSRNLGTNLEIHGEWARMADVTRSHVDASGKVTSQRENINSFLLGLRYRPRAK